MSAHAPSQSCVLPGIWAHFTSTFTEEKHFSLIHGDFFFNFLGTSTLRPGEPSPANLHSETKVKSALPANRPTEPWTAYAPTVHTWSSQTLCGHLCHQSRAMGSQAPYVHMHRLP